MRTSKKREYTVHVIWRNQVAKKTPEGHRMMNYSNYFETLHDEAQPTGSLGRGTHYSIVRSLTWADQCQQPLDRALNHDLAVIWDEDHDERVFELIEFLYLDGLLSSAIMVGERKGTFSLIITEDTLSCVSPEWLKAYTQKVQDLADNLDDPWSAEVYVLGNADGGIINDDSKKVSLYLDNLNMLWNLGVNLIPPHVRSRLEN